VLLLRGCYNIPDVTSLIKVAQSRRGLVARGLLSADEGRRMALVAALTPTLAPAAYIVSAEALAKAAGLAIVQVPAHIEQLRSFGFAVAEVGSAGYRLTRAYDDLLVPEAMVPQLLNRAEHQREGIIGLPYHYYSECDSTNQRLKDKAADCPAGTIVVTDHQTAGRGRLGRSWWSGPGEDLTFSVLLRPQTSSEVASLLSLAAALSVAEVLETLFGEGRVLVKWPNDVLLDGKKVCGILLESSMEGQRVEWVVVGLGLNVNSDPAAMFEALGSEQREAWQGKPRATSLRAELGRQVARGLLLTELLDRLSLRCVDTPTLDMLGELRARDALLGRWVQVFAGSPDDALVVAGEAQGIGPQGELLVRDPGGSIVPVFAGEVTLSVDSSVA
jgi:BirA family biotin operon repressor/biotin-[acetyl-CoA-carboxylase] ligase